MVPLHDMASGIEGVVILRPVSPVEWPGMVNERPYEASIGVTDAAGRRVAEGRSGPDGRFRIVLAPGTYVLHPESDAIYPQAPAQTVTVERARFAPARIVYDSGIR